MEILEKMNPDAAAIRPYEPGRPIDEVAAEQGLDAASIVKLASNENSLGPSPRALAAMTAALADCHRYPDGGAWELRNAIAGKFGLSREQVAVHLLAIAPRPVRSR